jgi:predicted permease
MSNRFLAWVRTKIFRTQIGREIGDELQFHLEMRTAEYERTGMAHGAAHRKALRRFGDLPTVTSECRSVYHLPALPPRGTTFIDGLRQDIRYATRTLVKQPGFTLLAVLTLGLGIGANAAIFSVVRSTLLHPLPFQGGNRLVYLWREKPTGFITFPPTAEMIQSWREHATSFDAIATYRQEEFIILDDGEPETLTAAAVSADLIPLLGVQPFLGRAFVASDTIPGQDHVVLLSEGYWRRRFAGDPNVMGRTILLGEEPYTVLGVLPSRIDAFFGGSRREIWIPRAEARGTVARLRPGVSTVDAQAELERIHAQQGLDPSRVEGWPPRILRPSDRVASDLQTGLWVLFGAVGFVVLVACANVANMILAKGVARGQELAIRSAVGAAKWRVVRQLVVESLLLTTLGAAVAVALASGSLQLITTHLPDGLVQLGDSRLDLVVLCATFTLAAVTGVLFGLVPAGQLRSLDLTRVLNHGRRSGSAGPKRSFLRQSLVAAEVAMAMVLFVGAGLLVHSLIRLQRVDPGFDPTNLYSFEISLHDGRYEGFDKQELFFNELLNRIRQLPNVEAAATGAVARWYAPMETTVVPYGQADADIQSTMMVNVVSPGYFATVGATVLQGREFVTDDVRGEASSVVVNEAFARAYWPGEEAVGKRFRLANRFAYTVIGVARDVRVSGIQADPNQLQVYFPYQQFGDLSFQTVVVRAIGHRDDVIPLLKGQVWSVDPSLPVRDLAVVTSLLAGIIARPRFNALLLSGFAFLTLALAAIGVYGVTSLTLQQHRHELGVRVALGARHADVFRLMLGSGMRPIAAGAVAGVALSIGLARFTQSLLYEVQTTDPLTYGIALASLSTAGFVACYLPARRATRVDPVEALRHA